MKILFLAELFWSGFLIFLAITGLMWLVPEYIQTSAKLQNPYLSPKFWPTIILYLLGILGACMLVKSLFLHSKRHNNIHAARQDAAVQGIRARQYIPVALCLCCMVGCFLLLAPLGMPLSITLCLSAFLWLSGERAPLPGVLCLFALPFLLYLFFLHVADVSIPLGIFG